MNWLRRLREAPATAALMAANLAVYVWMAIDGHTLSGFDTATMIYGGANIIGTTQAVSHWRLVTAAFVHFNFLHIAANMWTLSQIGMISELIVGARLIVPVYLVTGVLGNVASTAYYGFRQHPTQSAGASGAIMGLIGLVTAVAWRTGNKAVARDLIVNGGFIILLGLFLGFDNAAHIGGFVTGAAIGLARMRWRRPLPRPLEVGLTTVASLAIVAAFVIVRAYHGYH
jgi:rhomboid protease GluP